MKRACVALPLTTLLLPVPILAQTPEEIADAIGRLSGPREDARAMEFLIDAGEPAAGPIVEALKAAPEQIRINPGRQHPVDPKFARLLRVLRAIGPDAAAACVPLGHLVSHRRLVSPWTGREFLGDVALTLSQLIRFRPGQANEIRETILTAGAWAEIHRYHIETAAGLRDGATAEEEKLAVLQALDGQRMLRRFDILESARRSASARAHLYGPCVVEREFAADLLGPEDRSALPTLVTLLDEPEQPVDVALQPWRPLRLDQDLANEVVREAAARAIARIDPDHPKAVRGLALMVASADDPRDRVRAAAALGRHGAAAEAHVDVLLTALDSADDRLVAEAVTTLGMIGVASEPIVERLRALVDDPRPAIAERAKAALGTLETRDKRGS